MPSLTKDKSLIKKTISDLFFLRGHLNNAYDRAEKDRQNGFPNRTGENLGRQSGKSDPTATIALGPKDEIELLQEELSKHLFEAQRHIRLARIKTQNLEGLKQEEGRRLNDSLKVKAAECENKNCDHLATGAEDDRLRGGRCNACYAYYRRTGRERNDPTYKGGLVNQNGGYVA